MPQVPRIPDIGEDVTALMPAVGEDVTARMGPIRARGVTDPGSVRVTEPPAWNEPGGDVLLDNLRTLSGVARGASKELISQGLRGGATLRHIPGVAALAEALPSVAVGNMEAANTPEQIGKHALNLLEFLGAGKLAAAIPAALPAKMAVGGAVNAGLSHAQGAGPIGTAVSGVLGAASPALSAGLRAGATKTAERIETSLTKPTQADWRDGFRAKNVFKHAVGGTLEETYAKSSERIKALADEMRGALRTTPNVSVDLDEVTEEVARRYLGNKQASEAAGRLLDKIQFSLNRHGVAVP